MTKSDLFTAATRKNRLRKEAGLPLLDIRAEMKKEQTRIVCLAFQEAAELHKADFERFYAEERSIMHAEKGYDLHLSAGGQAAIRARATPRFFAFLASIGHKAPEVDGIIYGLEK